MIYKLFGHQEDGLLVVFTLTEMQFLLFKLLRKQMQMEGEEDTARLLLALAREGMIQNVVTTRRSKEEVVDEYLKNNPEIESYQFKDANELLDTLDEEGTNEDL